MLHNTRENNIPFRYYPGLFLWKPAREAHADFVMKYDSSNRTATGRISKATGQQQEILPQNSNSNNIATGATGEEIYLNVIEELERMHPYVDSCDSNPRNISYRSFLAHFPVSPVAERKNGPTDNENPSNRISNSKNTPVAKDTKENCVEKEEKKATDHDKEAKVDHSGQPQEESGAKNKGNLPKILTQKKCAKCGADLEGQATSDRLCANCHAPMGMSAELPGLGEVCMDCLEAPPVQRETSSGQSECVRSNSSPGSGDLLCNERLLVVSQDTSSILKKIQIRL